MKPQRRRLVHFVSLDSERPLCGGDGADTTQVALNGVAVCAACAQRIAEELGVGSPGDRTGSHRDAGTRAPSATNTVRRR
jgi:hypothetical protein